MGGLRRCYDSASRTDYKVFFVLKLQPSGKWAPRVSRNNPPVAYLFTADFHRIDWRTLLVLRVDSSRTFFRTYDLLTGDNECARRFRSFTFYSPVSRGWFLVSLYGGVGHYRNQVLLGELFHRDFCLVPCYRFTEIIVFRIIVCSSGIRCFKVCCFVWGLSMFRILQFVTLYQVFTESFGNFNHLRSVFLWQCRLVEANTCIFKIICL